MDRAMLSSASGMAAQQQNLDVIADNLANADVAGFKSAQATFAAIGRDASAGTTTTGTERVFVQGKLMKSGGPFDVAIQGTGFFQVERDGARGYTRAGAFSRSPDGRLRDDDGWALRGVRVPVGAASVTVAADGRATARLETGAAREIGRIRLASFDAPERLRSIGSAVFAGTHASGPPREVAAGGDRQPAIRFGMLEKSNVSIVESMMAILAAQRAYEANSKGVQAADEMQRIANNLHRS